MANMASRVAHRTGGLENICSAEETDFVVAHRTGGLEMQNLIFTSILTVAHRTGGLEMYRQPI